ncbi:MAG: DUF4376 domain-containing protein [Fretibacterium sp.]|nr:DUF4376 domain-containing protein [Fretibacterium sp.]
MNAHYNSETGEILGFYTPDIHGAIPEPNVELSEEQWQAALSRPHIVKDGCLVEVLSKVPTLNELKRAKLAEIANARYRAEGEGIAIQGVSVFSDRESQAMITGAALQATLDPEYVCKWKTTDGFVTLDAGMLLGIAQAVREHVQSCFDREAELAAMVEAATTAEEVAAVVW